MLDWKMDWYGGIDHGMDYGIYISHSNTQLYCVAICLLTYVLIASSALYWPAFVQPGSKVMCILKLQWMHSIHS